MREALTLRPGAIQSRLALAALLEETGRRDEALAEYARCVDLVPDDATVYMAYAGALYRGGELDKAIVQLHLALEVAPGLGTLDQLISQLKLGAVDEPSSRQAGESNPSSVRHVEMERREETNEVPATAAPGSAPSLYVFRSNALPFAPFTPPVPSPPPLEALPPAPPPDAPEVVDSVTPSPEPAPRSFTLTSTASGGGHSTATAIGQVGEAQEVETGDTPAKAGSQSKAKKKKRKQDAHSAELDPPLAQRTRRPGWIRRLAHKVWRRVAWPD